jgi:hypothetical protein
MKVIFRRTSQVDFDLLACKAWRDPVTVRGVTMTGI